MPDEPTEEQRREREEREREARESARPLSADRPGTQYESESVDEKNDLRVKARRMSDDDRRRKLAEEEGHPEKYQVTDANPATGGVYPPSAVVTPFDPEIVAAHTPGETVEKENERSPDP